MIINSCPGRIFEHVKVEQLKAKWRQDSIQQDSKQQDNKTQEGGLSIFLKKYDEDKKATILKQITDKMMFGKKLSREEMDFLKNNSPEIYAKALRIEKEREEFREALRNCKSKEQALHLHIVTVMQPNLDPEVKMALFDEFFDFAKSKEFGELPNEHELDDDQYEENQNKRKSPKNKPFQEHEIKIKSPAVGHYSIYNKDRILVAPPSTESGESRLMNISKFTTTFN